MHSQNRAFAIAGLSDRCVAETGQWEASDSTPHRLQGGCPKPESSEASQQSEAPQSRKFQARGTNRRAKGNSGLTYRRVTVRQRDMVRQRLPIGLQTFR